MLERISKEHGITSLVLAKYDDGGRFRIMTHMTLGVSRLKMKQTEVREDECQLERMPEVYKDVWLKPMFELFNICFLTRTDKGRLYSKDFGRTSCQRNSYI